MAVDRYNRWISYMALCGVLQRAVDSNILPMYYVKGGVALELRFGTRARASKDIDLGLQVSAQQLLPVLDRALRLGFDEFRFTRKKEPLAFETGAVRVDIALTYRNRPWGTIDVDLSEAETTAEVEVLDGMSALADIGLPRVEVPCLAVEQQVAHKIHAMTETFPDRQNTRFRDLVDIVLLEPLIADYGRLHSVCAEVFERRAKHVWPPDFTLPETWKSPLIRALDELGLQLALEDLVSIYTRILFKTLGVAVPLRTGFQYRFARINIINTPEYVNAADVDNLNALGADGWRVVQTITVPAPPYDRIPILVLEREHDSEVAATSVATSNGVHKRSSARFQLRLETQSVRDELHLVGALRNVGTGVGNRTRVTASGVDAVVACGTLAPGDDPIQIDFRYDNSMIRSQLIAFSSVLVQFQEDDGGKWMQAGDLFASRPDASGRYSYRVPGLGPARAVPRFTVKHDNLENLDE